MAAVVMSLLADVVARFGYAAAFLNAVLQNGSKGFFTRLVPADVTDDRRARITAFVSGDVVKVRVNVAPKRKGGPGTQIVYEDIIGPATYENAALALRKMYAWDANAMSVGFGVSPERFPTVAGPIVKWVRNGGAAGRFGARSQFVTSDPFANVDAMAAGMSAATSTEQPVAEQSVAEQPVATVDVIGRMSAATSTEQPVAEQPVAEQPVAEQPGVRLTRRNK